MLRLSIDVEIADIGHGPWWSEDLVRQLLGVERLLVSLILLSTYEGRFSEPKMPCSRDTVNPPAPITTSTTSGIHSRLRTLKIEIPSASFPAWAPGSNMQLHTVRDTPYRATPNEVGVGSSPTTVTSNVRRLEERGEVGTSILFRLPPARLNTYGIVMHTACVKARYGVIPHPPANHVIRVIFGRWRSFPSSANLLIRHRGRLHPHTR